MHELFAKAIIPHLR